MPDWMAFNVADYVANTLHLTARQHGAYILLICAAWGNKGILPGSDAGLMAIAKLSNKEWKQDGDTLKAFLTRRGEAWVHERVEFEWNDAQALIEAKSKAGKEGARRRWHGRANSSAMAEPQRPQWQNDAPLPEPKPCSEEPNGSSGADAPAKDQIFAECLPWANKRQGADCRSLIAKLMHAVGDDEALRLLRQMMAQTAIAPKDWIGRRIPKAEPREDWNQRRIREAREAIQ